MLASKLGSSGSGVGMYGGNCCGMYGAIACCG